MNDLEKRIAARVAAVAPPGTELTPERRRAIVDDLSEFLCQELTSSGAPQPLVQALVTMFRRAGEPVKP